MSVALKSPESSLAVALAMSEGGRAALDGNIGAAGSMVASDGVGGIKRRMRPRRRARKKAHQSAAIGTTQIAVSSTTRKANVCRSP